MRWFMERFRVNSGIIELLNQYLIALANRGEKIWWVTIALLMMNCENKKVNFNKDFYLCRIVFKNSSMNFQHC